MKKYVIDAIHVDRGGGILHLQKLLENWPSDDDRLVVFCKRSVKERIHNVDFGDNIHFAHSWLVESGIVLRYFYEYFLLPKRIKSTDVLISLTGTYIGRRNYISVSQNALLWERKERLRYFPKPSYFRILLLRYIQVFSFKFSSSVVVPTEFMRDQVKTQISVIPRVVKLGKSKSTRKKPESSQNYKNKIKAIYVSSFDKYKHHEKLVQYMDKFVQETEYEIDLLVVGDTVDKSSYVGFLSSLNNVHSPRLKVHLKSGLNLEEMEEAYSSVHVGCFMSTCENPSLVLIEMMSHGLPILAVDTPNNREVVGLNGRFFDLTKIEEFQKSLTDLLESSKDNKNGILVYEHLSTWKEFGQGYKSICDETMD